MVCFCFVVLSVQVQKSAHSVLMHAIDTQEVLKTAIMDKVDRHVVSSCLW